MNENVSELQLITRSETGGQLPLPPRVQAYIEVIVQTCADGGRALVSVVLFGSAATGGFSESVSDVDLLLVLPDGANSEDRHRLRDDVARLEVVHGFREEPARPLRALEAFVERVTANVRSFFVCTRGDLVSLARTQARQNRANSRLELKKGEVSVWQWLIC